MRRSDLTIYFDIYLAASLTCIAPVQLTHQGNHGYRHKGSRRCFGMNIYYFHMQLTAIRGLFTNKCQYVRQ